MTITASQLRQDVYQLLDRVLETGEPLAITRKHRRLLITRAPMTPPSGDKLAHLPAHPDYIVGAPEDLVTVNTAERWNPEGGFK